MNHNDHKYPVGKDMASDEYVRFMGKWLRWIRVRKYGRPAILVVEVIVLICLLFK